MDVWAIVINGAISLATSGVLGYFTYFILNNMKIIFFDHQNKSDKKAWQIFFGCINLLSVYLCYVYFFNDYPQSILVGLSIGLILAFIGYPLFFSCVVKGTCNFFRKKQGLAKLTPGGSVWSAIVDKKNGMTMYVYDLRTHKLLTYGSFVADNEEDSDMDFELYPYSELDPWSYAEVRDHVALNDGVRSYVNVDKNIEVFVFPNSEDEQDK